MKKLTAILTPLFLLLAASSHAEIVWDSIEPAYLLGGGPQVTYTLKKNGGSYYNFFYNFYNSSSGYTQDVHDVSQTCTGDKLETIVGGASVTLNGEAAGGITANGFYNTVASKLEYTNFGTYDGLFVEQDPYSKCFRNFYVTSDGTATISASITGDINYDMLNYDWVNKDPINETMPFYGYTIEAYTEVITFSKTQGLISASPPQINLDNDRFSNSITMDLVSDPDIYYVLHNYLKLDTAIHNDNAFFNGVLPLDNQVFEVGNWDIPGSEVPLMLTSSVIQMQTPVPGSLILLISGMGGLFTARQRFTGKVCKR